MSTVEIPQELIDDIVDNLSSDTPSLIACSTVSHSFRFPARHHLFHRLWVSDRKKQISASSIAACPAVSECVRELFISQSSALTELPRYTFPNLTSINIQAVEAGRLMAVLIFPYETARSVRSLVLHHSRFESTFQLFNLISDLKNLESLTLTDIELLRTPEASDRSLYPKPPVTLKALHLSLNPNFSYTLNRHFLEWISRPDADIRLTNVQAHNLGFPDTLAAFSHFLCARGKYVKHLSLSFCTDFPNARVSADLKLQAIFEHGTNCSPNLSSLQSLYLPRVEISSMGEISMRGRYFELIHRLIAPSLSTTVEDAVRPNPSVDVEILMTLTWLRDFWKSGAVKFDWDALRKFFPGTYGCQEYGSPGGGRRKKVNLKIVIRYLNLDYCTNDNRGRPSGNRDSNPELKELWKRETEEYLRTKFMAHGGTDDDLMGLELEWHE